MLDVSATHSPPPLTVVTIGPAKLLTWQERTGTTRIHCQGASSSADKALRMWVYRLRRWKVSLMAAQVQLLDDIGFEWHLERPERFDWMATFNALSWFLEVYERWPRFEAEGEERLLARWIRKQRTTEGDLRLTPHRRSLLASLGIGTLEFV
jgi:hypothetical protein